MRAIYIVKRTRPIARSIVIATALAFAMAIGPGIALLERSTSPEKAYAATCGLFGNYQAGYIGYATPPASWNEVPMGVAATIEARSAFLCTGAITISTAWTMLYDLNSSNRYAQSGYIKYTGGSCNRHFAEYDGGAGFVRTYGSCVTDGSSYQYMVLYTGPAWGASCPSSFRLNMYAAGTLLQSTNFDPWCSGWSFGLAYDGEAHHPNTDIPGTSGNPANFSNLQIQPVDVNGFRSTPCYLARFENLAQLHAWATSCTDTYIWSDPLHP